MNTSGNPKKPIPYNITTIESWLHFIQIVERYLAGWAFRGQEDSAWPLSSTLSRYLKAYVNQKYWIDQERRNLRIFQRKAHQFLTHIPSYSDTFEWLALMQHHGAPTRLLDFTWSPYVAAFFALERTEKVSSVWALNPKKIKNITERYDEFIPDILQDEKGKYYIKHEDGKYYSFDEDEKYFYPDDKVNPIGIGEPFVMNKRLIAQSGTFVVTKTLDKPIEQIVSVYDDPAEVLARLDFPLQARNEAMRALYSMNITRATLFPGLDGLARSLAYELEFHWAYDPRKNIGEVDKKEQ